jgi:hypothetical protein
MGVLQLLLAGEASGNLSIHLGTVAQPVPFDLSTVIEANWRGYAPASCNISSRILLSTGWANLDCSADFVNDTNGPITIRSAWLTAYSAGETFLIGAIDQSASPFQVKTLGMFVMYFHWLIFCLPNE